MTHSVTFQQVSGKVNLIWRGGVYLLTLSVGQCSMIVKLLQYYSSVQKILSHYSSSNWFLFSKFNN